MAQLFVYGSLRKGMYNYEKYLKGNSTFISMGYVKGELYTLQDVPYPALLPGDENILGELYEVDDRVEKQIDELEGYQENNPQNDYDKIEMEVQMITQDMTIMIPVYMFNMKKEDNRNMLKERISCNDYVAYISSLQMEKEN